MKLTHRGLVAMSGIAVVAGGTAIGGQAVAVTSPDETPTTGETDDRSDADGGGDEADTDAAPVSAGPPSPASVALSGDITCSIRSTAEASTRWRYGRARSDASIDEATSRVRVSGSGSGCDGLKVDFSAELLVPVLHVGSYTLGPTSSSPVRAPAALWANLWARRDRSSATPDLEWDTRAGGSEVSSIQGAGAGPSRPTRAPPGGRPPATLALIITSLTEMTHASERVRDGTVTLDTTRFRVHGSIRAALPCARAGASSGGLGAHLSSCRAEALVGSF
jgi:hypothetical protein